MIVWPSGWTWHTGHSDYPMMIVGIYTTLGVFLIFAARDPLKHLSLIWFMVRSSVVHAGIMTVQAISPVNPGHFMGGRACSLSRGDSPRSPDSARRGKPVSSGGTPLTSSPVA